jgi:phosphoribosylanthranilate isomerase
MSDLLVKICGLREVEHAQAAVAAGADLVGFVFAATRRYVSPEIVAGITARLPPTVQKVGLFVNAPADEVRRVVRDCGLDYAQLCGEETPEYCRDLGVPVIRSLRVRGPEVADEVERFASVVAWCQLDGFQPNAYGGTGTRFDWRLATEIAARQTIVLAGGLTPENVAEAITVVRPRGVDVSSGVETDGRKDSAKITAFVRTARAAARPFRTKSRL